MESVVLKLVSAHTEQHRAGTAVYSFCAVHSPDHTSDHRHLDMNARVRGSDLDKVSKQQSDEADSSSEQRKQTK